MKKFFKENLWWIVLAFMTIGAIIGIACIPDDNFARKVLLTPFYIIAGLTILVGMGEVIGYFQEKNYIKQTWQVVLVFIVLVFSIIALAL